MVKNKIMDIKEIFNGNKLGAEPEKQIMTIPVDWSTHSKGIIKIAEHYEPNFEVTKENENILRLMLLYFTGNPLFETETKGSLNKGIMLVGGVGTGKSLLFKIFQSYTRNILLTNSFQNFTAIDIVDSVNINGVEWMQQFSHNVVDKISRPIRCYIDDIASRQENVMHFGTKTNVIEQLLSLRYNVFERYGTLTHVSTNLYPASMAEFYESRIIDRMKEMFNIIELGGESFRK